MSTATLAANRKVDHIERGPTGRAVSVTLKTGFMFPDSPNKRTFKIATVEEGHEIVRKAIEKPGHKGPPAPVHEPKRKASAAHAPAKAQTPKPQKRVQRGRGRKAK